MALCTVKRGGGRPCGGALTFRTDSLGRLVASCARCTRRAAGVCRDCPRPVAGTVGKADRCAPCRARALRDADERWKERDPQHARAVRRVQKRRRRRAQGRPMLTRAAAMRVAGRASGLAQAARMTPEERSARARLGGLAAQAKRRAAGQEVAA